MYQFMLSCLEVDHHIRKDFYKAEFLIQAFAFPKVPCQITLQEVMHVFSTENAYILLGV